MHFAAGSDMGVLENTHDSLLDRAGLNGNRRNASALFFFVCSFLRIHPLHLLPPLVCLFSNLLCSDKDKVKSFRLSFYLPICSIFGCIHISGKVQRSPLLTFSISSKAASASDASQQSRHCCGGGPELSKRALLRPGTSLSLK